MTARKKYTISEYRSIKLVIPCQDSPRMTPTVIKILFHISVPITVNSINRPNLILDIPAGIDIKLRTTGTILPINTVQ
ncbi:hypothetical protein OPHB3_2514 [Oceanobacillus picturae]|uniref:Uncharacterized protein n=1 Tax=Oceanobacillus picturae TaxID=171693 RepID=A0A0U9I0C7_9BACI|nr:hypothetical protein OPHB3_2514 [Oceanobacillus picturae]